MFERMKWLAIMVTIAGMVMGAQTLFEHLLYPSSIIVSSASIPPLMPSATPVPTTTTTPARNAQAVPGVYLVDIVYDPTGSNFSSEYVLIANSLDYPVDLAGWTLRDDRKNIYTFPTYSLGAGQNVKIWTRTGVNSTDNLYWSLHSQVWNNGGDCGYLRNDNGKLQSYICY